MRVQSIVVLELEAGGHIVFADGKQRDVRITPSDWLPATASAS